MNRLYRLTLLVSLLFFGIGISYAAPKKIKKKKEKNQLLEDFINQKSYKREHLVDLKSPFRNLIKRERIINDSNIEAGPIKPESGDDAVERKLAIEKVNKLMGKVNELADKTEYKDALKLLGQMTEILRKHKNTEKGLEVVQKRKEEIELKFKGVDPMVARNKAIEDVHKRAKAVNAYADKRDYNNAVKELGKMLVELHKHENTEKETTKVLKRKKEILQEKDDWNTINGLINSLTVDAMFMAQGKRKIALINNNAVEEGDLLNEVLNKNKLSPIKLIFVSNNSVTLQFKKFTLKKDLIDND